VEFILVRDLEQRRRVVDSGVMPKDYSEKEDWEKDTVILIQGEEDQKSRMRSGRRIIARKENARLAHSGFSDLRDKRPSPERVR
jgi:hypothetical protein